MYKPSMREFLGLPEAVGPHNQDYLTDFEPKVIEESWETDFDSTERRVAANQILNLLEAARDGDPRLAKVEVLRLRAEKDAWGGKHQTSLVRYLPQTSNSKLVSVSSYVANDYRHGMIIPGMAVFHRGQTGGTKKDFSFWLIPLAEGKLLEFKFPRENDYGELHISVDSQPAARSDLETALNMIGCYFRDQYEEQQKEPVRRGILARVLGRLSTS